MTATKDPQNAGCVGCLALRELDSSQGRGVVRDSLRRIASSESWSRDVLQASFTGDVDASFRSLVQNDLSKAVQLGYTYDPQKHLVVCELVGDKHFRGPLSVRVVEAESGWDYEKAVEASKHRFVTRRPWFIRDVASMASRWLRVARHERQSARVTPSP